MKILSVVGARPNFMKIFPIISAINKYNQVNKSIHQPIRHLLVHTGQHYDNNLSDTFFKDLNLPNPDIYLGVGSASHAVQTAEIMKRFEEVLLKEKPDVVIVVGDVNSTLACALVASKIEYPFSAQRSALSTQHLQIRRPLIAHVEAGLRSFDRSMPEEINRILTDHISDFLFVTEPSGIENLKNEGFKNYLDNHSLITIHHSLPLVAYVGNTMIDTLLAFRKKAEKSDILEKLGLKTLELRNQNSELTPYGVLTLHRPSNVDDKEIFLNIIEALKEVSRHIPIFFPAHPRTQNRIIEFKFEKYFNFINPNLSEVSNQNRPNDPSLINSINLINPLGYLDFLCLMSNAKIVLTDSGGIQEETTCLGIPCITLRNNTERPITVTRGTNMVIGTNKDLIIKESLNKLNQLNKSNKPHRPPLWDGKAAKRIVSILAKKLINERKWY